MDVTTSRVNTNFVSSRLLFEFVHMFRIHIAKEKGVERSHGLKLARTHSSMLTSPSSEGLMSTKREVVQVSF